MRLLFPLLACLVFASCDAERPCQCSPNQDLEQRLWKLESRFFEAETKRIEESLDTNERIEALEKRFKK